LVSERRVAHGQRKNCTLSFMENHRKKRGEGTNQNRCLQRKESCRERKHRVKIPPQWKTSQSKQLLGNQEKGNHLFGEDKKDRFRVNNSRFLRTFNTCGGKKVNLGPKSDVYVSGQKRGVCFKKGAMGKKRGMYSNVGILSENGGRGKTHVLHLQKSQHLSPGQAHDGSEW